MSGCRYPEVGNFTGDIQVRQEGVCLQNFTQISGYLAYGIYCQELADPLSIFPGPGIYSYHRAWSDEHWYIYFHARFQSGRLVASLGGVPSEGRWSFHYLQLNVGGQVDVDGASFIEDHLHYHVLFQVAQGVTHLLPGQVVLVE